MVCDVIRVGIDIGGTFTDLVAVDDEAGKIFTVKVRSTPRFPEIGFREALERLLKNSNYAGGRIGVIIHVGTIGTNLFLGQLGLEKPKVCLITTKGFKDVIEIGRQNRPRLYDVYFTRPSPLVPRQHRLEVNERTAADGSVLTEVREEELQETLSRLREINPDSLAICFLNSYANPHNEEIVKNFMVSRLNIPVFTSYEVDPEHREYERFSTTVVNAVLAPVVSRYINSARKGLETLSIDAPLYIMSSAGGIVDSEEVVARPIVSVESGPAAGVVGASQLSSILGLDRVISLDLSLIHI